MDLMDVMTQAIKLEKDGHTFYLKIADMVKDENGQRMFRQLAEDEVNHLKYIERQYEALRAGQGWSAIPEMDKVETLDAVSLVFPPEKEALAELPSDPTEEDALLFALGVEDKSFQLYYNSSKIATDEQAKMLFAQLASAEHTHFNILMQRYEGLFPYPR